MTLRLMSYNVRYFGHATRGLLSTRSPKRRIAAALAALPEPPHVVCLQEVETISMRSSLLVRRRHAAETQLESFMAALEDAFAAAARPLPYEAFYFRAHTYGSPRSPLYTTGLAILVDQRVLGVLGHNAHSPECITHHHVVSWRDTKQTRICAHLRVDWKGRPLHVFNTHLSLPTPFARAFWRAGPKMGWGENQLHEARALVAFVRKQAQGEPFVVCGDFNSAPGSPVYRYLTDESGLVPALAGLVDPAEPRRFPTAGVLALRMHLDHLFAGEGVGWLDVDGTASFGDRGGAFHGLSDHVPLLARFSLRPYERGTPGP